ncbi:MAG: hypothetical protein BWZ07_02949 [Alphaproteobacteria bacterium ADurb.BinA280]|nr:MAG: hypothetical protein BWZ07_02949 [Alphaproteobacteria bacterium ADurb.BinA280]
MPVSSRVSPNFIDNGPNSANAASMRPRMVLSLNWGYTSASIVNDNGPSVCSSTLCVRRSCMFSGKSFNRSSSSSSVILGCMLSRLLSTSSVAYLIAAPGISAVCHQRLSVLSRSIRRLCPYRRCMLSVRSISAPVSTSAALTTVPVSLVMPSANVSPNCCPALRAASSRFGHACSCSSNRALSAALNIKGFCSSVANNP